jgi:hypothetical protein
LKVPANFTNRGTGNVGTNSGGVCTARLGACGSALTGCCACASGTRQPKKNKKPIVAHLMVRFMGITSMGKRSYRARLERLGIERIREIARENGKKGGRPPKKERKP